VAIEASKRKGIGVILGPKRAKRAEYEIQDADATSANLLMLIGAAFALVGIIDLTLLWTPLAFGNPAWEFTTLGQTFSNVPLSGLGVVLVGYALVRHPKRGGLWVRGFAVLSAAVALLLVAMGILYLTVVPAVVRQTPVEGLDALGDVLVKNGAEIVVYPVAFALISFVLWRSVTKVPDVEQKVPDKNNP
jgi:hypothetical protein